MNTKKCLWIVAGTLAALVLVMGAFGCAAPKASPTPAPATPTPQPAPVPAPTPTPIIIKGQTHYAKDHAMSILWDWYIPELEKRTGGKVKFDYVYGTPYGGHSAAVDNLAGGVIDFAHIYAPYTPGRFPTLEFASSAPFRWKSAGESSYVYHQLTLDKVFDADFAKGPYHYLFSIGSTPYVIFANKPVKVPSDLKGIKIRGPGGLTTRAMEAMGATAISVTSPETYLALQKGVIDATVHPLGSVYSMKLYEVAKYGCAFNFLAFDSPGVMSDATWQKLPADVKKIIADLAEETSIKAGAIYDAQSDEALAAFAKMGISLYIPTDAENEQWESAAKPLIDQEVAKMKASGIDMDRFLNNITKFKQEYASKYGK